MKVARIPSEEWVLRVWVREGEIKAVSALKMSNSWL